MQSLASRGLALKICVSGVQFSEVAEAKFLQNKEIDKIFITDNDIRHIKNHHGQNEDRRGQIRE